MKTLQDLKYKYKTLDVFGKIIAINFLVFLVHFIVTDVLQLAVFKYFELPTRFSDFILQPWALISYGFIHYGFIHILINLLILYYISRLLINLFRPKMILNIYFLGIIFGGLAFLFFYNVVPPQYFKVTTPLVGASAGIRALIIFISVYNPNTEVRVFTFNIKLKYIAMVLVGLDILGLFTVNQGGNIAHLGGALLGYIYAVKLNEGKDFGAGFERFMDSFMGWFTSNSNLKTVHRKPKKAQSFAGKTKAEFNTYNHQKKIDLILDKISKSGYESLTAEEKAFLFKAGK